MNALDFFHCNFCFSQPGPKSSRFFLTNCGHSFCNECVNQTNGLQCRVCKACCKAIPLTNNLPEDLKLYFVDMVKEVKHLLKVLVIQNKHCKIYMEDYAKKLEASYAENHRELNKVKTELTELKKHYQELVDENRVLKKNASNLQMTQVRNKSPFGLSGFSESPGKTFIRGGSAFLTPSQSSASRSERSSQGRSVFSTPESLTTKRITPSSEKMTFNKPGFRQSPSSLTSPRSSIPPVNSQPFVLSSQPLQAQYSGRSSRGDSTSRSWSSSASSRNTTKTIRKSRDSFISKMNNSSIF